MIQGTGLLLVGAVAAVGVLHTIVPDHWLPIALIARERGWSRAETARAALQAGTGHVLSTLVIGLAVWAAGVAVAQRFGQFVDAASGIALIGFGGWVAFSAWRELYPTAEQGHGHSHCARSDRRARPSSWASPPARRPISARGSAGAGGRPALRPAARRRRAADPPRPHPSARQRRRPYPLARPFSGDRPSRPRRVRDRTAIAHAPPQNDRAHCLAADPRLVADGRGHPGVFRSGKIWGRADHTDGCRIRPQYDHEPMSYCASTRRRGCTACGSAHSSATARC